MRPDLLAKYDIAAPRYTSYPTVPYWTVEQPSAEAWFERVQRAAETERDISLYIHLPFCESLCTYCGCNKHITKNHAVEIPYLRAVLREWKLYRAALPGRPVLRELHLGGGTPTFFQPEHLRWLLESIFEDVEIPLGAHFGFEAHPNSTTEAHLRTLYELRFRRVSIGVQDFDDGLMQLVNRQQTAEEVLRCTETARQVGYHSINYDLIFGLPRQTEVHIQRDADYLEQLRPDRIAFYSYAHVPWLKQSQTAYSEADLPGGAAKRRLYEAGRERLEGMGYLEIGMDHFALPTDTLSLALEHGTLHRNFMGYTPMRTPLMIGLGASAIGDTWNAFAQNEKTIAGYQLALDAGRLPVFRGHFLTEQDRRMRKHILQLMTRDETTWFWPEEQDEILPAVLARLEQLAEDGLVELEPFRVRVTAAGRPFLRNICMAFDAHYWAKQPEGKLFSQAV
ncbi:MAG: oxygen-independent coproporphyrinogen III oxidase [Saprospiraceae bacterium]|nr:oxygen-independent coproporphyrinogen III oxidase [Saprospiraceae bacterium]